MGCWNGTCAISNLYIEGGQDVVVFRLLKNNETLSFCYTNALYDVSPIPFYGIYDYYGGVESCHGAGLPVVLDAIKERLYKFGTGANQYHDIPVNKENFDIDMLFSANLEDRLGIESMETWSTDIYRY